jgi:flagellar motor switch protein FliM
MEVNVKQSTANVSVQLATGAIKTRDFLDLKIGDVMTLDKTPSEEAMMMIEGSPKFYGYVGSYRGNRAVRLTREIPRNDLINYRNREEQLKNGQ